MIRLKEKILDFFYSIPRVLFIKFYRLLVRIRVFGIKKVPLNHSAILAVNHATGADPIILLGAIGKKIYFVASSRNFGTKFTDFFMRKFTNSIPIFKDRFTKNSSTFKELFSIAKKGNALFGIFPEGKLNKGGKLEPFHRGAAYLSFKTSIPIIPVYIHNIKKGVNPKSFIARSNVAEGIISIIANTFNRINVFIGDPIKPTAEKIVDDFMGLIDTKNYKDAIDDLNKELVKEFSDLEKEAGRLFPLAADGTEHIQP
jgi:1-acyl-sn-glycerol-3-phosphate acyltransferase